MLKLKNLFDQDIILENKRAMLTPLKQDDFTILDRIAFEVLEINRVELKTDVLNWQSRKAISKLGATEEGIFRMHQVTSTGRVRDSVYYSIIADEWPAIKKNIFPEYCS